MVGFGQLEEVVVFPLAEVVPAEELLEADQLGAFGCGFPDPCDGAVQIAGGISANGLLDQTDSNDARSIHKVTKIVSSS